MHADVAGRTSPSSDLRPARPGSIRQGRAVFVSRAVDDGDALAPASLRAKKAVIHDGEALVGGIRKRNPAAGALVCRDYDPFG